ncbi:MAG TPA: Ig-like domain-containing protein, partial [Gemmatimonadaceae bacterium]|nr:Ig-like domain-containing protein [Gemmatimonadaceae bacterium]
VNGQLFLEHTGLAMGAEAFDEFHFPWKSVAPPTSQSEYFWDMVVWEPAAEPAPPPSAPAPVASVQVSPTTANVEVGQTVQLNATLRDSVGNTLTGRTITWASTNPAVASVSSTGLVTGVAAGTTTVSATSENQSGTATVTVVEAPPPPPPPPPPPQTGLAAFPGATGFGATTPGGRGGTIIRVTNLNDTGPGSLREALAASGPRVVIFEVSGTIRSDGNMVIANPYVTIAGQTAPSPGITIRGATLRISTHDVVIQHIRLRPGDDPGSRTERDGIEIYGGTEKYNILVDHVSVSWGVDENVSTSTTGVRHDITLSNMIIAEGLNNSIHPEGPHSKGVLIGQGTKNIAMIGNLLAHNLDRNPWYKGNTTGVIVNNVVYNYGGTKGTYFDDVDNTAAQVASVIGNVYVRGVNSPTGRPIRIYSGVKTGSLFYIADNSWDRAAPPSDPWSLVQNDEGAVAVALTPPISVPGLVARPNASVEDWVLNNAGARPADRDAVDLRLVQEVRSGTGRIIDHPSDVGGWPLLAESHRPLVTPANPNGDDDGDGYTNLEEWLHQMAAEVEGRAP